MDQRISAIYAYIKTYSFIDVLCCYPILRNIYVFIDDKEMFCIIDDERQKILMTEINSITRLLPDNLSVDHGKTFLSDAIKHLKNTPQHFGGFYPI
jgi:hypothetical protein